MHVTSKASIQNNKIKNYLMNNANLVALDGLQIAPYLSIKYNLLV